MLQDRRAEQECERRRRPGTEVADPRAEQSGNNAYDTFTYVSRSDGSQLPRRTDC